MNIIKPILYNQNEVIQVFNPQSIKALKISDDYSNTKNMFNFNMWTQSRTLDEPRKPHVEIKLCVGPTKLKGFQFLIVTHIIDETIVVHSLR
jgi:hypothetical protein